MILRNTGKDSLQSPIQNCILYSNQIGFQKGYSTGYTIIQLADQLFTSFEVTSLY